MEEAKKIDKQEDVFCQSKYEGTSSIPTPKQGPASNQNEMCPSGLALYHPAAGSLLEYATNGCPMSTGKPQKQDKM